MDTGLCTPERPEHSRDAGEADASPEQDMREIGFVELPDGTWRYEPPRSQE